MEKRLESWKENWLSFGGQVVLIKSDLSSLLVYSMSLLKAPSSVISRLESIQNRFLWSGSIGPDKIHWIKWDLVKSPIKARGIGIQDLRMLNSALLCKRMWRYATERNAWWRRLIFSKCGEGVSAWKASWNFRSGGCSLWRWVVRYSSLFWKHGFIDLERGFFLSGSIIGWGGVLVVSYSRVLASARTLDVSVFNARAYSDRWLWVIPLRFNLRGGAFVEWQRMSTFLDSLPDELFTEGPSSLVWPLESIGVFSVSSLRRSLSTERIDSMVDFPYSVVWNSKIPSKVSCFCWKLFLIVLPRRII
ncbi:Putative ribonuclease H protein At1g65750 [Linum perenne]